MCFPLRETDWEVDCLLDDQVSGAIKEAKWDQGDVVSKYVLLSSLHSVIPTEVPSCHDYTSLRFGTIIIHSTPHYFASFLFASFASVYFGICGHVSPLIILRFY